MPPESRLGETLLGKYRVLDILGRGGMGVVYEALDLRLGRRVAIKILTSTSNIADAGYRFQREARTIASLMHPNLVTLLDYDVLGDGTPAMVMERVDGVNLRRVLMTHRFSVDAAITVLLQTLDALAMCHEHGIIHRDLKPENLLVQRGTDRLHVKVIDFGLTKLIADSGATALTVQGQVYGSPRFMAPEQWLQKPVDGRTDLYALGLIGYCLLLGRHFIEAETPFEICRSHIQQPRPVVRETAGGEPVSEALDQILRRAAAPDPQSRFANAMEMRAALKALTPGSPPTPGIDLDAPSPPTGERAATPFDASSITSALALALAEIGATSQEDTTSASQMSDGEFDEEDQTVMDVDAGLAISDPDFDARPANSPRGLPEMVDTAHDRPALRIVADDGATTLDVDPPAVIGRPRAEPPVIVGPARAPAPAPASEIVTDDKVRAPFPGGIHTAITRGDVERAMQASSPPVAAPAPAPPAPRPASTGERHKPTVQLDRFTSASLEPAADRRRLLVVGLAVVTGALATAVTLILILR